MVSPYRDDVLQVVERLRGHVTADDEQLRVTAMVLILASNFGAGDALAGLLLRSITSEKITMISKILRLTPDNTMVHDGPFSAMLLLDRNSEDSAITELLKELDDAASAGTDWKPKG